MLFALFFCSTTSLFADGATCVSSEACTLFSNLTSVHPTEKELEEVQKILVEKGATEAGKYIVANAKEFVNVTLRTFADTWSDVDGNSGADLNSTSATIIAAIMQDLDFRKIMYDDMIAQGNGTFDESGDTMTLASGEQIEVAFHNRNKHYEQLEALDAYHKKDAFIITSQVPNILKEVSATAGILTTRGFAAQAFQAGTNRRSFPMLLREGFCLNLDDIRDPNVTEKFILRDVGKKDPDGSVTTFKTVCKTCHGMMDQVATATIYHDFSSGSLMFDRTSPIPSTNKMMKIVDLDGHIAKTDEWRTDFTKNQLNLLELDEGFRSGFGLKSLGTAIANSNGFAKCQVQKAFQVVCGKKPSDSFLDQETKKFRTKFNLKETFINSAVNCKKTQ